MGLCEPEPCSPRPLVAIFPQVFVQLAKRTPYTKVSLYVSFVEIYMEKLR
jgi:hypothetical protein